MGSRGKNKGKPLPTEGLTKVGYSFSKQEVVFSEVGRAIRLFLVDNDLVSSHLLAGAAREILRVLIRKMGKESLNDLTIEQIKDDYHQSWVDELNTEYNWFKHGGKDADQELEGYQTKITEMLLFEISIDILTAFPGHYLEPGLYLSWFMMRRPHFQDAYKDHSFRDFGQHLGDVQNDDLKLATSEAARLLAFMDGKMSDTFPTLVRNGVTVEKLSKQTYPKFEGDMADAWIDIIEKIRREENEDHNTPDK